VEWRQVSGPSRTGNRFLATWHFGPNPAVEDMCARRRLSRVARWARREQRSAVHGTRGSDGLLAIHLSIGLLFAGITGFVAHAGSSNYFAQGTSGNESDDVYFSFAVMTTTGFGDLSAATHAGRALAVIEMLTGQLYLVTVIGAVVGILASRTRP